MFASFGHYWKCLFNRFTVRRSRHHMFMVLLPYICLIHKLCKSWFIMFCWCTCVNTLPHFVNQRLRCGIPCILSSVARPYAYRQVCNIRRTLVGNKIVDHSDVVGASPVGAAPTTSSFPTEYLVSINCAKTTARQDERKSFVIWCDLYQRFDGTSGL